jgi:hypothetical protein
MDVGMQLAKSHDIAIKIRQIYDKRSKVAQEKFSKRVQEGMHGDGNGSLFQQLTSLNPWSSFRYAVDVAQRSILFWDTLRHRCCTSTTRPCSTAAASIARSTMRCCASRRPGRE